MLPQLWHIYAGNKQLSSDTSVAVYFRSSSNVGALRRTSDPQLVALLLLGGRLREPHHMVRDHRQQLERGRVVTARDGLLLFARPICLGRHSHNFVARVL